MTALIVVGGLIAVVAVVGVIFSLALPVDDDEGGG